MASNDAEYRNARLALRQMVRAPGFTVAAVATLALGIGVNAAIFSLIQSVLISPLPYADANRLAMLWNATAPGDRTWLSLQEVVSYRDSAETLQAVGAYMDGDAVLTGDQEPERVRAATATGELFQVLGVEPALGRWLTPADSVPGAADTAVLSYALWQRRFGAAPGVVGAALMVNGRPRTVVGVMPASFRLPLDYGASRPTEIFLPQPMDPANLGPWGSRSYLTVARLAEGIAPAEATAELAVMADRWVRAGLVNDQGDGRLHRSAIPMRDFVTGDLRRPLLLLFAAVGVVLLIACANVVNLLLARADVRRREMAVRATLGARRRDLVRQLMSESVLLALAGGACGLAVAWGTMRAVQALRPTGLPRVDEASIDLAVLVFTGGLSVLVGVAFGIVPALQLSREALAPVVNEASRGTSTGTVRLAVRRTLVVAQLACALMLVASGGLLIRSLVALNRVDLGFDPHGVLTAHIQLPQANYASPEEAVAFYERLTERLAQAPGVASAGAVRILPFSRTIGDWSISIEGRPAAPHENPNGDFQFATPGYLRAMGLTLLRGRWLSADDRAGAPAVAVINDTMAARYWPGTDALGQRFQMGGAGSTRPMMTIVGIVKTSRHNAILEETRAEIYLPLAQVSTSAGASVRSMSLAIRTDDDPAVLSSALRDAVRVLDRNLPVADVRPMAAVTAEALAGPRFAASLLGLFALLALGIAAIGTYATVSLLVAERSREIGIRMALGAERTRILIAYLKEGSLLAGTGAAAGVAGALIVSQVLQTMLYEVDARDPSTLVVVTVVLVVVALMATLVPARRASSVDPASILRM